MPSDQEFAVPLGGQGLNFRDQPSIVGFAGFIDAVNWRLDEDGAPTKRLGYDTYRDPGGSTVALPAVPLELTPFAPYGGTNTIIAACADGKSYTSPGDGTWTQIATGMSASALPDYAMLNDVLYWSNGIDAVQSWTGTVLAAIGAAPKGTFLAVWRNRLWVAGVAGFPHRVYWSAIGDPTSWPALNFVDIHPPRGDAITALAPAPNLGAQFEGSDGILVYTSRSVHRIYDDTDNATGAIVGGGNSLIDGANGCVNQRTLVLINGRVWGVAKDGIYSTDGHHPLLLESGRLGRFFENQANQAQRDKMCAVAWHGSYLLSLTRAGEGTNGLVLEVYTALPRMSGDSQHPIMAMDIPVAAWAAYPATTGDVLYFADSSTSPSDNRTYVRRYGQGGWDTDSLSTQLPITADAQTGATTFGIPHPKHVRRIQLAGRGNVTIGVQADFETGAGETQSFELTGTDGGVWGVGVWGTGVWGGAEDTGDATRWYIKRGRFFSLHLTETSVRSGTGRATLGGVSPPIGGASIYSAIVCVTPLASDS
jgi:hypothetical protein